jgi:glycogen debranching enzyme
MPDTIKLGDKWYISASSARSDERAQVLKHDGTFALLDRFGDMRAYAAEGEGLYQNDTRFLSLEQLLIDGERPLFLNSNLKEDNSLLVVELMNPDLARPDAAPVAKGTVHIFRAKLLWQSVCYEHIRIRNYGLDTVALQLQLRFSADYRDIFEVRGVTRVRRGHLLAPDIDAGRIALGYRGLDDITRRTALAFDPEPAVLTPDEARFDFTLDPGAEDHLYCTITCEVHGETVGKRMDYQSALRASSDSRRRDSAGRCRIETSHPLFNFWLERSASDLGMLTTQLKEGPYPYAGVPWYSTTFGRDGILTAREYLWIDPAPARGVLTFLAATQATEVSAASDAEPGKILHEARQGEMAHCGEVPFARYYGTVDATPLFVGLAGAYHARTGDLDFIRAIWPHIERALEWIDRYGDADGDGFVEYARHSKDGLDQQGWKDSRDSVFHANGDLAAPPIALCEVQGYVYDAKLRAAALADALGKDALATKMRGDARALREKFEDAFWSERIGSYAIALDGGKRRCEVRASNAGHVLWSGIASPARAARVVEQMRTDDFFSGWGVRTVAAGEARYNPMSYHNGSVWPHDNALIAAGMARYGHTDDALRILCGLFDASLFFDQHRLPELFCGFSRRPSEGPTLYPVACSPQAWASAAVFMLVQACLGLEFSLADNELRLNSPRLPGMLEWMKISNLAIGEGRVDVMLRRHGDNTAIDVLRKEGRVDVIAAM